MFDVLILLCFLGIHDLQFTTADTAPFARSIGFFNQAPKFANPFRIILVMVHNPEPQIGVNVAFRDVQRSFFPMLGKKNGRLSLSQKKKRHFDHWYLTEIKSKFAWSSTVHGVLFPLGVLFSLSPVFPVFFFSPGPRVSEIRKYGGFQIAKEEFCKNKHTNEGNKQRRHSLGKRFQCPSQPVPSMKKCGGFISRKPTPNLLWTYLVNDSFLSQLGDYRFSRKNEVQTSISGSFGWVRFGRFLMQWILMWLMFLSLSKELYSTTAHQVPWHGLDDDEGGSWCPICLFNMEDSPRS